MLQERQRTGDIFPRILGERNDKMYHRKYTGRDTVTQEVEGRVSQRGGGALTSGIWSGLLFENRKFLSKDVFQTQGEQFKPTK